MYIDSLIYLLPKAALFTSLSNVLAGLAGVFVSNKTAKIISPVNEIENENLGLISKLAVLPIIIMASALIMFVIYEFVNYGIHGGRYDIIAFENSFSSIFKIIRIFRVLFVPFVLLYISFSEGKKYKKLFGLLLIVWCIIEALNGKRTSSLSSLLAIILFGYYKVIDKAKKRKLY